MGESASLFVAVGISVRAVPAITLQLNFLCPLCLWLSLFHLVDLSVEASHRLTLVVHAGCYCHKDFIQFQTDKEALRLG